MKIRQGLIYGATLAVLISGGTAKVAKAEDQAAFNKSMDAYLEADENVQKIGDSLEKFFKKKRAEQEKLAVEQEKKQMEDSFNNPVKIDVGTSPSKGPKDAPITIVEFSDFQCPFCRKGASTMDEVLKAYPDKVKLVFKNLPLPFHPEAQPSARASLAAANQGKFWEMHDKLFQNQQALGAEGYTRFAQELNLDMAKFKKDMEDPALAKQVEEDSALATKLNIRGTPGFFVNGVPIHGAQPVENFKELIERWLAKKKG